MGMGLVIRHAKHRTQQLGRHPGTTRHLLQMAAGLARRGRRRASLALGRPGPTMGAIWLLLAYSCR